MNNEQERNEMNEEISEIPNDKEHLRILFRQFGEILIYQKYQTIKNTYESCLDSSERYSSKSGENKQTNKEKEIR